MIKNAIEQKNADELRHHAHKMKGSAATLGAVELAQACRQLEGQARTVDLVNLDEYILNIQSAIEHLIPALKTFSLGASK